MSHERDILRAIKDIAGDGDPSVFIPCTVNSYNEATRTCTCTPVGGKIQSQFSNVLLMPSVDDGILYLPTAGSTVIITYSKFQQPYVSFFSSIDKILYIVGSSVIKVIDGTIQFNDGSFGGLTKVEVLTQKLNNLENLLNDLISKYNTHTHLLTLSSGTGTAAPTETIETNTLTPTQQTDIENSLITHGE
jgi:hypothetical protein